MRRVDFMGKKNEMRCKPLGTGRCYQLTLSNTLNWIVGPYRLIQSFSNMESFYSECIHLSNETIRAFQLTDSESCLKVPYNKLGFGGPGTWRNGEVSSSYTKANIL